MRTRMLALAGLLGCCVSARAQDVLLLPPTDVAPQVAPQMPAARPAARPAAAPRRGMSLDEVIGTMLAADPKLRVGQEEVNQAIAEAITASLKPNPVFSPDVQLLPITRAITVQEQGGPPQLDAIVSYPVDWFLFGKRKAAMLSADIGVRQTQSEYCNLMRLRIRDVALGFFEVIELKGLREVAQQDVDNLAKVEAIVNRAVQNGGRPAVELNRIRLDLLTSQQLLRDVELAVTNAKARLRALTGGADFDPNFDVDGSLDLPNVPPPPSPEAALAIAQENRPDLAALRLKVSKAEVDVDVARRKAYPDVNLRGGYTHQFQGSIGFQDIGTVLVGADMSLPVFDRKQGLRANAAALLARSQYEFQLAQVDLRAEIEQSLNDLRVATVSAHAVEREQLKLAEQVRDAINKAYEAGGQPLLNVLDAQRNYRETYRRYITQRANYWRSSVRLNATLGKKVVP